MKVLDLFSGIGGFSLGLERTGFKTVAFCEIDKKCQLVLKKHWPNVPIYDDVRKLNAKTLRRDGIKPDIICGGFPCQDISIAGKKAGINGEQSGLWSDFFRLISEIRPQYAIVENSSNLFSGGFGAWVRQLFGQLASIRYDAEGNVISAAGVGALHLRERVYILAYPSGIERRNDFSGKRECNCGRKPEEIRSSSAIKACGSGEGREIISNTNCNRCDEVSKRFTSSDCSSGFPQELQKVSNYHGINGNNRRHGTGSFPIIKKTHIQQSEFWAVEPEVGRVVNGFPGRVDRITQLGNAVVPYIPELIGYAINEFEAGLIMTPNHNRHQI